MLLDWKSGFMHGKKKGFSPYPSFEKRKKIVSTILKLTGAVTFDLVTQIKISTVMK